MRRSPFKDGIISQYSFGIGTVPNRMGLTSAEELATVRRDWLRKVCASDFEEARQQTMKAAAKKS